jgi:putative endonuclease
MKNYYVYIITNQTNTTLYVGMTNDLPRRVFEHKNKLVGGFSKKYNLKKLVYFEQTNNVDVALNREKQLKNWHREWKFNLIKETNPGFKDLSIEWYKKQELDPELNSG